MNRRQNGHNFVLKSAWGGAGGGWGYKEILLDQLSMKL